MATSISEKLEKLFADGQWHDRRELMPKFDMTYIQIRDAVRALPSFKNGELISGEQGWRLAKYATRDEIEYFTARLRAQANSMLERVHRVKAANEAA
jgi:hypothetical protein